MKNLSLIGVVCSAFVMSSSVCANGDEYSTYIYNGEVTSSAVWPSYSALYYDAVEYTGLYGQYCGSTIIDSTHVATAAHCISDDNGGLNEEYLIFTSVLPQLSDSSQFLSGSVERIRVKNVYRHPDYIDSASESSVPWPNDIAVLELNESMNVSSLDYAELADSSQVTSYRVEEESFIAVGMGLTETGRYADQLLYTDLTYEPNENCVMGAGPSHLCMNGELNETTEVRNTTCSGDSGGPLYWYDNNRFKYIQVGITSYGWNDCHSDTTSNTSVFTEVADYSDWIQSVLNKEVSPDLVITSTMRDSYISTVEDPDDINVSQEGEESSYQTSSSGSSGGSTSYGAAFFLLLAAFLRRRVAK